MNLIGHPKRVAVFAATKLFTAGAAGASLRPTAPPMNNFG
jgi:hypothetical protein